MCNIQSISSHFWGVIIFFMIFLPLSALVFFYKKGPVLRVGVWKCTIKVSLYYFILVN